MLPAQSQQVLLPPESKDNPEAEIGNTTAPFMLGETQPHCSTWGTMTHIHLTKLLTACDKDALQQPPTDRQKQHIPAHFVIAAKMSMAGLHSTEWLRRNAACCHLWAAPHIKLFPVQKSSHTTHKESAKSYFMGVLLQIILAVAFNSRKVSLNEGILGNLSGIWVSRLRSSIFAHTKNCSRVLK